MKIVDLQLAESVDQSYNETKNYFRKINDDFLSAAQNFNKQVEYAGYNKTIKDLTNLVEISESDDWYLEQLIKLYPQLSTIYKNIKVNRAIVKKIVNSGISYE